MPRTKTITVYSFDELPKDVQEKILSDMRTINVEHTWWDDLIENEQSELENMGYTGADIRFSGFYSQGDGASFTARDIDLLTVIKRLIPALPFTAIPKNVTKLIEDGTITATVWRGTSHYVHENTVSVSVEKADDVEIKDDAGTPYPNLIPEIEKALQNDVRELSKTIYKRLENEYDFLTSDEQIKETVLANDWTFEDNGKINNI